MSRENITALPSPLGSVRYQFERWRGTKKTRRERIPEELWSAAIELRGQYSVNQISQTLRLNYNDLKKRILGSLHKAHRREQGTLSQGEKLSSGSFVEFDWRRGFSSSLSACLSERDRLQSGNAQADECVIEMEDAYGSKMRMSFKGHANLDLLELGKAFWSKSK